VRHVALVTGGSRGIGEAICRRVAREGATVLVAARSLERCTKVAESIRAAGGTAWPLALDVADPHSIEAALDEARRVLASAKNAGRLAARSECRIDWLVNNAGIAESAPLGDEKREARMERQFAVNFHGARRLMEALLPDMESRGYGRIVNVASSAGLRGYAYVTAYCASKFALVGYSLAVADELDGTGVGVNLVCPHYVDSPLLKESVQRLVKKTSMEESMAREFFRRSNPGERLVTMEEVAEATVQLLHGVENGAVLELDGSSELKLRHPNRSSGVAS